jgi:hypothetical protein
MQKVAIVLTGHHLRLARIKAHEPMTTEPKKRRSATCLVSIELRSLTDPSRDRKGLQVKNAFTTLTAHRSLDGLVADGGRRINRVLGQARAPGWKYHTRRVGPVAEAGESNVLESGSHRGGCQVSSGPRLHFCSQCTPHAATVAEEREKNERVGGQGRVGHRSSVIA